jgi:hypothetical protein
MRPSRCRIAAMQIVTPSDVAPAWPMVPPMARGLPVTTPGVLCPRSIETVSMIQLMTCGSVLMSGAGMSRSEPITGAIEKA